MSMLLYPFYADVGKLEPSEITPQRSHLSNNEQTRNFIFQLVRQKPQG